ncbi:MAG: hypothetical protein WCP20_19110 [Desulfuromonadales bacterium]
MISKVLADILRAGRSEFNARFVEARRRFPGLSGEMFLTVLQEMVDPVVTAVAAIHPDYAAETVSVAYDVALELAGQNLAGPGARSMAIAEGWRRLLPAAAAHLAEAPRSILPAVSNVLHHLATTPGARPAQWVRDMTRLAGQCRSPEEFLKLGQILAWRSGMAHYRSAALVLLDSVPEELALQALECNFSLPPGGGGSGRGGSCDGSDSPLLHPPPNPLPSRERESCPEASFSMRALQDILSRLARDPWYDPAKPARVGKGGERLRPVRRIGAFRGFGGLFIEPPRVTVSDRSILVRSGDECWLLTADCFGATFHRCDPALFAACDCQKTLPGGMELDGTTIRRDGFSLNLGQLGAISSAAATVDTLAITSPLTHSIVLIALT